MEADKQPCRLRQTPCQTGFFLLPRLPVLPRMSQRGLDLFPDCPQAKRHNISQTFNIFSSRRVAALPGLAFPDYTNYPAGAGVFFLVLRGAAG